MSLLIIGLVVRLVAGKKGLSKKELWDRIAGIMINLKTKVSLYFTGTQVI